MIMPNIVVSFIGRGVKDGGRHFFPPKSKKRTKETTKRRGLRCAASAEGFCDRAVKPASAQGCNLRGCKGATCSTESCGVGGNRAIVQCMLYCCLLGFSPSCSIPFFFFHHLLGCCQNSVYRKTELAELKYFGKLDSVFYFSWVNSVISSQKPKYFKTERTEPKRKKKQMPTPS